MQSSVLLYTIIIERPASESHNGFKARILSLHIRELGE